MKKIIIKLLMSFVFIWLLAAVVIWQTPAKWLIEQAQVGILSQKLTATQHALINKIEWQLLEGTIGSGQARSIEDDIVHIEHLKWNISLWRLVFLWPAINLKIGEDNPWIIEASLQYNGTLHVKTKGGELDYLHGSSTTAWRLQGPLKGELSLHGKLTDTGFQCRELNADLNGELKVLRPLNIDLGTVNIKSNCTENKLFKWKTQINQIGQHKFNAEGEVTPSQWSFLAKAEVKEGSNLNNFLNILNWPQRTQSDLSDLAPSKIYSKNQSGVFKIKN